MPSLLKRMLLGRPLKTAQHATERLSKLSALAIFSSDALSSVAYATEEILLVLVLAGAAGMAWSPAVALAIVALMLVVTVSYAQIIKEYPSGGGAYTVAKENLGTVFGLIAGASLLVDYVLVVAVSLSAGMAAVSSALPSLHGHKVGMALVVLALLTVANLRGLRESGKLFAVPAYAFIATLSALIVAGVAAILGGGAPLPAETRVVPSGLDGVSLAFLLHAFAAGCTALTGIEAISNGVQAFRKPEARNARITLAAMGGLLAFLFAGITFLARSYAIAPSGSETVVSQIAAAVFGRGFMYYATQCATAVILLLAANTAFAGFPQLASILAADRFLPVQLVNRGDRLVHSNGILALAVIAAALIVGFDADTHALIPLYAIGVFIGFSLSQFGMVRRWWRERHRGWRFGLSVNLVGGVITAVVLAVITEAKFAHGAWAVLLIVPLLVALSLAISRHYRGFKLALSLEQEKAQPVPGEHIVIIFLGNIHKGAAAAARYAKSMHPTAVRALHIAFDENDAFEVKEKWKRWGLHIPLLIVPSPYRQLSEILVSHIQETRRLHPRAAVTVIVPEFVCKRWWHELLHNRTAARIKHDLLYENVACVSVPVQIK